MPEQCVRCETGTQAQEETRHLDGQWSDYLEAVGSHVSQSTSMDRTSSQNTGRAADTCMYWCYPLNTLSWFICSFMFLFMSIVAQ